VPVARTSLVLAFASLSALSSPVTAGAAGKKPTLSAGANTIAGPGRVTVEAEGEVRVLLQSPQTPLDLCLTVVNVGPAGTAISGAVKDPGSVVNTSDAAPPGDAASVCRAASNEVSVRCLNPGATCSALWRVDQPR
jgi:hypothetical protein